MIRFRFRGVELDAFDPNAVGAFWTALVGWRQLDRCGPELVIEPPGNPGYRLFVRQADSPKSVQNRIHFDLTSSTPEHMSATIDRARRLGAVPVDVGQSADEPHVVLTDIEGNEFCVIEPTNRFLADTGTIGAINCDGTRALGLFWSRALHWPLVWDHGEETAIQARRVGRRSPGAAHR